MVYFIFKILIKHDFILNVHNLTFGKRFKELLNVIRYLFNTMKSFYKSKNVFLLTTLKSNNKIQNSKKYNRMITITCILQKIYRNIKSIKTKKIHSNFMMIFTTTINK